MMKENFTPGPWKYDPLSREIVAQDGTYIAIANFDGNNEDGYNEKEEATAKLIAAAPDMYTVIKELYDWSISRDVRGKIFPQLEAIINKVNQ